jgi:hypothetical protein
MRAPLFTLKILLVTILIVAAAWFAVGSVNISGLVATNLTAAEVIKQRCPLHLVRPDWVAGSDQTDILLNWPIAEMKARLAVLLVAWVLSAALIVRQHQRRQTHGSPA